MIAKITDSIDKYNLNITFLLQWLKKNTYWNIIYERGGSKMGGETFASYMLSEKTG